MSDKDFKVKNGLVVDGDYAIINGNKAITSASLDHQGHTGVTVTYDAPTNLITLAAAGGGGGGAITLAASDPYPATNGDIYFNTANYVLKIYYNAWLVLSGVDTTPGTPFTTSWDAIYDGGTPGDTTTEYLDGGSAV